MADRTVSTTTVQNGPTILSTGLNHAYSTFAFDTLGKYSASVSNTLHIHMVPIPNNARILDMRLTWYDRQDAIYAVGDLSLSDRYITATSLTTDTQVNRLNNAAGAGYKISLSNSNVALEVKYEPLIITMVGSTSASGCVHMSVYYRMEPNTQ